MTLSLLRGFTFHDIYHDVVTGRKTGVAPSGAPHSFLLPQARFSRAKRRPQPPEAAGLPLTPLQDKVASEINSTSTGHEIADFVYDLFGSQLSLATAAAALVDHGFVLAKDVAGLWCKFQFVLLFGRAYPAGIVYQLLNTKPSCST